MGAGKSTIGRQLAVKMGREFVDSDSEIEHRTGADIPWIFDVEGESGFRDREQAIIAELAQRQNIVVATGGGAILREANRAVMAAAGVVVYLQASIRAQVKRTAQDRSRPLLATGNRQQILTDLMRVREPLYSGAADITVKTEGSGSRKAVDRIIAELVKMDMEPNGHTAVS
ncbi:shikimate kinase [Luminiphilus syltensis NOR5-1B]|uniref:Shikimate kinase n=2 Tax=Luminiphilus TaxID=1341118 RepID=B8KUU1_9GAMM|nr:shikimate kinase [Luminiphilus syltensis NOR5-1B]